MHHLYPTAKGDPLCPLGFHPQVRWPTKCKRCFRDYKEHGGGRRRDDDLSPRKKEDVTASSPSLSTGSIASRPREDSRGRTDNVPSGRSWASSQNLSSQHPEPQVARQVRPASWTSWTSTPDLGQLDQENDNKGDITTVSFSLPKRRLSSNLPLQDTGQDSVVIKKPPTNPNTTSTLSNQNNSPPIIINRSDSLAERVQKMQAIKRQNSLEKDRESSLPPPDKKKPSAKKDAGTESPKRIQFKEVRESAEEPTNNEVQFLVKVKKSKSIKRRPGSGTESSDDDTISIAGTDTTETTIVDRNENDLLEQIESLRIELEHTKTRAERAEREKSDILLRRLAAMDTTPSRTTASEVLKLQQKVNELKSQSEDLKDDRKSLSLRVRELEVELAARPSQRAEDTLRNKLLAAETLCEELMDENEDMKREMRNLEDEMDEVKDKFSEQQTDEYSMLKKELEQTTKNCRVLSFKLKKAERRTEQLEAERQSSGGGIDLVQRVRQLEQELSVANEVARRLQEEADKAQAVTGKGKKKPPMLGTIGKSVSAEGKVSRESLTRGGSQEDPVQLLRDLQDSLEREADLREQLRYAEEEAQTLRSKASRVEDDNESLVMQLKKMATKARSRKLSPTSPSRLTPEPPVEKDEGISDDEDPAELRLLLELNEQEASVLRRKVGELEAEGETSKRQLRELTERLASKSASKTFTGKATTLSEQKMKVLEDEVMDLRNKLLEKEREFERIHAELNLMQKKPKGIASKNKSLDGPTEQQALDLRRQLQVVEQEATVLRTRTQALESDNDKLSAENKKLQMQALRSIKRDSSNEKDDATRNKLESQKLLESEKLKDKDVEITKLKQSLSKLETERDSLNSKLKSLKEEAAIFFPARIPKKPTDAMTKLQLKKIAEDLENEVGEMVVVLKNAGVNKVTSLEAEKVKMAAELKGLKDELSGSKAEIKLLQSKREDSSKQATKVAELEKKIKSNEEALASSEKALTASRDSITKMEKRLSDQIEQCKTLETSRKETAKERASLESKVNILETSLKQEKDKVAALKIPAGPSPELVKLRKEHSVLETKAANLDSELQTATKQLAALKVSHEKEIVALKAQVNLGGTAAKKLQELQDRVDKSEAKLASERKQYGELTAKYEMLEEEHVVTKAQLTMEKEAMHSQLTSSQAIAAKAESEIQALKESLEAKQEDWTKEKYDLQSKLKGFEDKMSKNGATELERSRLKSSLQERLLDLEQANKEKEMANDQVDYLRKENDELKKKLDDYEKVNKAQRNRTADTSAMEKEIKKIKAQLSQAETSRKTDLSACKLRYDGQLGTLNGELQSLQGQVGRFKRERDTFKQMLESAQKTISDLKNSPQSGRQSRGSIVSFEDSEENKMKIATLEQQIGCMEDELCEARMEASKLKTELVSERSSWEIKKSEMQSKVNELEEERLISTGRTKITGLKTRMELAWQKEREEQQRLLQETSKLARDLRQTLFEVERERDKERLEAKRKQEQLKKTTEEEQEENRKKVTELQCDLLELRDAHAKLRTTNEKLRREKERHEREREELRRRRYEQDGDRKVNALLDQVEELVKIAPELQINQNSTYNTTTAASLMTPTPPRRSKSRESSPVHRSSSPGAQLSNVLARLADASEELRKYHRMNEEERDRDRARRNIGMRRAASTEHDNTSDYSARSGSAPRGISRSSNLNGSLHRKSLSLTLEKAQPHDPIWKNDDDSMSSMQSLDADGDSRFYNMKRETSLDSRLSGGSTQSDVLPNTKRKKKSLMGKLKQLTKSRSIDDHGGSSEYVNSTVNSQHQGSDSDMSVGGGDHRSSKRDLKDRLTGMFKKSGSTSRSNSTERGLAKKTGTPLPDRNDSTQRPLVRNGSSSTLPRAMAPGRPVPPSSASSTTTPGVQRRTK